jgi:hypothetical protein
MKQPWLKFFPSDWRADPALRMCSLAARGLWIEMLCLMHEARPHGSLLVNGKPVTAAQLANLVGGGVAEVEGFLAELEEAGVFSRDADGALYSRRMRRDEERAAVNRVNGRAGGNPSLKQGVNPAVKAGDKAQKPESRLQTPEPENSAALHHPPLEGEGRATSAGWGGAKARDSGVTPPRNASRFDPPHPKGVPGTPVVPTGYGEGVAATGAKLDEIEAACRAALGEAAPDDVVIGPMLAVVERFGAERVCLALASEARRKRRRPIKSWRLWAEIACESLAEEPRAPPPAPGEMAALLNGESVPRAALMAAIERWNAGGDWPTSLGGPPRRHGCALPETFLAMCAEV